MIHISPTLQEELGIHEKDHATLSIADIYERTGINSGLSINIRNNIRDQFCNFIDIVRMNSQYPDWFQVVREY